MANGKITLGKQSGGTLGLVFPDGVSDTEVVLPESGELATKFIGSFINAYTIFSNCIVAFGGEFNRADYPKLWAYLQSNPSLVKTQAQWTTESTANGGICGFFSDGDGTTTFRVPNLDKAFLRPDSRGVASYQDDIFKSHTHTLGGQLGNIVNTVYNGFQGLVQTINPPSASGATGGIETRPKNIAVLPLIVAK